MSEESKTAAQAPEAEAPLPMKLEVRVRPIEPKGNLLGFATLVLNDSFVVDGLKVLNSDKGLYVGMPSVKDERSKTGYRETAKPITSDFRKLLNDAVIGGYHAEVQHLQEKAARIAEGPASIDSQLAKGAEKAAAQAARPSAERPSGGKER